MKKIEAYMADDGKIFESQYHCLQYEAECNLRKVNPNAIRVRFEQPTSSIDDGFVYLFHAENREEFNKMIEFLRGDKFKRDAWGADEWTQFPANVAAIYPDDYDWFETTTAEAVIDGMRSNLTDMENWLKGVSNHD